MKMTVFLSAAALLSVYGFTTLAVAYGDTDFGSKARLYASDHRPAAHRQFIIN